MNENKKTSEIVNELRCKIAKLFKITKFESDFMTDTEMSIYLDIDQARLHKIKHKKGKYSDIMTLVMEILKMGGDIKINIYDKNGNEVILNTKEK